MASTLALIGGAEWTDRCSFDRELLERSTSGRVTILPTARAYERPNLATDQASQWLGSLGADVEVCNVLNRTDAFDARWVDMAAAADFVYVSGGSPMHLRSVLKDSPVWDAVMAAHRTGAVLAGAAEGATVLCSHMVDSRGGAFTLGLEELTDISVVPRFNTWSEDKWHRTLRLAPAGLALLGVDEATAVVWDGQRWASVGAGSSVVYIDGQKRDLADLSAWL